MPHRWGEKCIRCIPFASSPSLFSSSSSSPSSSSRFLAFRKLPPHEMVVSIRLPSESHSPPPHYSYRHRSPAVFSPRLWRRILPLALLFVLAVESYRLILAQSLRRASPRTLATPQPLPVPRAPPPHDDGMFDLGRPQLPPDMAHLVVVACHAIWKGGPTKGRNESEWVLEPFQRGTAAQDTFAAHIEAGVRAARQDPRALLVFSGGESRAGVGPRTEATSYFVPPLPLPLVSLF